MIIKSRRCSYDLLSSLCEHEREMIGELEGMYKLRDVPINFTARHWATNHTYHLRPLSRVTSLRLHDAKTLSAGVVCSKCPLRNAHIRQSLTTAITSRTSTGGDEQFSVPPFSPRHPYGQSKWQPRRYRGHSSKRWRIPTNAWFANALQHPHDPVRNALLLPTRQLPCH